VDGRADERFLLLRGRQGVVRLQERLDGVVDDAAGPEREGGELLEAPDLLVLE
jgi:hypothetical protein